MTRFFTAALAAAALSLISFGAASAAPKAEGATCTAGVGKQVCCKHFTMCATAVPCCEVGNAAFHSVKNCSMCAERKVEVVKTASACGVKTASACGAKTASACAAKSASACAAPKAAACAVASECGNAGFFTATRAAASCCSSAKTVQAAACCGSASKTK